MANERLARVLKRLEGMGLRQLLVSDPHSIFYLTGKMYFPGERILLMDLSLDRPVRLYINELLEPGDLVQDVETVQFPLGADGVGYVASKLDPSQELGVDKELTARYLVPILKRSGIQKFRIASDAVDYTRQVKDAKEIALMRESSRINDLAFGEIIKLFADGATEISISERMPTLYRALGADSAGMGITAYGANTAIPHHWADGTKLRHGDAIIIDAGCEVGGYCSDMTRTFFWKSVDPFQKEIFGIVRDANAAAKAMIRPGVRFSDVDKAARDVIEKAGYGAYFTHRLGHSIGLTGHEFGDVGSYNADVIQAGMTFTDEPGIYLPGRFGVRIEDVLLVTETGCESLNGFSRDIIVLGN